MRKNIQISNNVNSYEKNKNNKNSQNRQVDNFKDWIMTLLLSLPLPVWGG